MGNLISGRIARWSYYDQYAKCLSDSLKELFRKTSWYSLFWYVGSSKVLNACEDARYEMIRGFAVAAV
jgi:hypothetical protein